MNASRLAQNATTGVLVICAIVMTVVAVRRELMPTAAPGSRPVSGWTRLADNRIPAMGPDGAGARIVLFSDYQCPFCKDLDEKLSTLVARHPGRLSVIRYEYPLTQIHAAAYAAAIAAKCAGQQGVRQAFQAKLFSADLPELEGDFSPMARSSGVPDVAAFSSCMEDTGSRAAVDADIAEAKRLGIESVPAFIVDGQLYQGTRELQALEHLVEPVL